MPIRWDKRNKRWRFEFDRWIKGQRVRTSRLLPQGWTQEKADAFDRKESGRLYEVATGLGEDDPLIERAVVLYLDDKEATLKSFKQAREHLLAIAWAYEGKPMSKLAEVCDLVQQHRARGRGEGQLSDATVKQRLAILKAACRWAWKKYSLTANDPTQRMTLPTVKNERHNYLTRAEVLRICRRCNNWGAQIAIRVGFYSGLRLGEIMRAVPEGDFLVLADTKNGDRRVVPIHPKIAHLKRHLPLPGPKITLQRAWERARDAEGFDGTTFHDLRHSFASALVNAGVDIYTVSRLLGHRDFRSTKRYAHLDSSTQTAAVRKIK